jgi:uncharacterized protein YacL
VNGIAVLNVNELADSLRPVFCLAMPCRSPRQGGREAGEGRYLDDGTMVVVDAANGSSARPSTAK